MSLFRPIVGTCVLALLYGCAPGPQGIFAGRPETWDERARQLSLEDRYRAFRYGLTNKIPPVILSEPMADGGARTVTIIQQDISRHPDDYVIVGSLHVYDSMKRRNIWNICVHLTVLHAIQRNADLINSSSLKQYYTSYLHTICSGN